MLTEFVWLRVESMGGVCVNTVMNQCVLKAKAKAKAVPLHSMKAIGGRGGTHSRPRH
jgi:hypothetical protein